MVRKRYGFPYGLPDRLAAAMRHKKMGCGELAERSRCNRKTIYGYLHGDTSPNAATLARMCLALNITADWLLFGKEEQEQ